jgi:putative FmdB family regulatory protein
MAIYEYLCSSCGSFEVTRPMGTAAATHPCLSCDDSARRAYSAPLLNRTTRPLADAITRAERSRDQPEVVRSVPPLSR